jgi:hypothetical protein
VSWLKSFSNVGVGAFRLWDSRRQIGTRKSSPTKGIVTRESKNRIDEPEIKRAALSTDDGAE